MIFPACKRVHLSCLSSFFDSCTYVVRQNASHRLFSISFSTKAPATTFKEPTCLNVKTLLLSYGFTETHISELKTRCPIVFNLDPRNNVLPKLKFFTSIGLSKSDIPKLVLGNIYLLAASLQNKIIPSRNFLLNSIPLTNDQLLRSLKIYPGILVVKVDTVLAPNISLLREIGLSQPDIASVVVQRSSALCRNHKAFKSYVDRVISLGLQPSMKKFLLALKILCGMSDVILEQKIMLYKSYGMSDDEFLLAFQKQPSIIGISKDNISKSMEFLIEGLKWKPSGIARVPEVLSLSLDKVVRRSRVLEKLVEKGLERKNRVCSSAFLKLGEKKFLERYVDRYVSDLPEILDIYDVGGKCMRQN